MAEFIGKRVIKLNEVDSTNNYAIALCNENSCDEGTIVVAKSQLQGRGQRGNSWESLSGLNLLCSVILFPEFLPVSHQFLISKVVALAISDVVADFDIDNCTVKWPNDVYVGDMKIAGILIENSIMGNAFRYSVAGIGLNVNQTSFSEKIPNPVSLTELFGAEIELNTVLNKIILAIDKWYNHLTQANVEFIDATYLSRLYNFEKLYLFNDKNGRFSGRIKGVDEIGRLLISDTEKHLRTYHFKEVEFVGNV